jgi:hypothetical protein
MAVMGCNTRRIKMLRKALRPRPARGAQLLRFSRPRNLTDLRRPFEHVIKAWVAPDEQHYSMTGTSPKHAFWNAPLFGIAMKTGYRLCFENTNEFERTQF